MIKAIDTYLAVRHAAGFDLSTQGYLLRSFARFSSERGEAHVRTQTVVQWASLAPSAEQRDTRMKTVARFARHVHAEDDRHEVPPKGFFGYRKKRRVPFIYSRSDIERLVGAASRLRPTGSLRPHTYSTLFALLASTGLRISEALALRFEDVTPEGLHIRNTKFQKSRLVPLHPTAEAGLQRYLVRRKLIPMEGDHVFVSDRGPLCRTSVYSTFLRLLKTAGLERSPGGRRPRIHELRHTFAVRALEGSPEGRDDIGRHMLALTTYMGHAAIQSTYWYLQVTPQLMKDISEACEAFHQQETS
jgi:integrase